MTSSLCVALAGRSARAGVPRLALGCLMATIALGAAFLVLKGFEYREDIEKHLLPGADFRDPACKAQRCSLPFTGS